MSLLIVSLIPPRRQASGSAHVGAGEPELAFVFSDDGQRVAQVGRCVAGLLPAASQVVMRLDESAVSWQRITLPRVSAARLPLALAGLLEESLLEDIASVQLALAPDAKPGAPAWVAVTHKPWLMAQLATLEAQGRSVDRVVAATVPDAHESGHFSAGEDGVTLHLTWCSASGVVVLPLDPAGGNRTLAGLGLLDRADAVRWTASPAAAAAAEGWLSRSVPIVDDAERALAATHSLWNLRQFDLAPQRPASRWLGRAWRATQTPAWRPVRLGMVALLLVNVVGMNLWAWSLNDQMRERHAALVALLQQAHPQVRTVLDAPLQMRRETDTLRAAAGRAGASDFETLMNATAWAWPDGQLPAAALRFDAQGLSFPATSWSAQQFEGFRQRLTVAGWAVDQREGRVSLRRAEGL